MFAWLKRILDRSADPVHSCDLYRDKESGSCAQVSGPSAVERCVMRLRLAVVRATCRVLLPRDVWVGKHFGAYTRQHDICLGKLDSRGVLQGVLDRDLGA